MIETMDRSTQTVLGFKVSGTVTKDDYEVLTPAVEAAIDANGSVSLLLDQNGVAKASYGYGAYGSPNSALEMFRMPNHSGAPK